MGIIPLSIILGKPRFRSLDGGSGGWNFITKTRVQQTRQALGTDECECFSVSIKGLWISVPCFIDVLCLHVSVSGCKRTSILVRRVSCAPGRGSH